MALVRTSERSVRAAGSRSADTREGRASAASTARLHTHRTPIHQCAHSLSGGFIGVVDDPICLVHLDPIPLGASGAVVVMGLESVGGVHIGLRAPAAASQLRPRFSTVRIS
jgi:hypothetical protein